MKYLSICTVYTFCCHQTLALPHDTAGANGVAGAVVARSDGMVSFMVDRLDQGKEAPSPLVHLLDCITKAMKEKDLWNFYIESGTLLGQARDQKLLPWDADVDLVVDEKQANSMLETFCGSKWAKMESQIPSCQKTAFKNGFMERLNDAPSDCTHCYDYTVDETCSKYGGFMRLESLAGKEPFWVDIKTDTASFQDQNVTPLQPCTASMVSTQCPANPDALLAKEYGKDWGTPEYQWDEAEQKWVKKGKGVGAESGSKGKGDEFGSKGKGDEAGSKGKGDEAGSKGKGDEAGSKGKGDEAGSKGKGDEAGSKEKGDEAGSRATKI